MHVTNIPKHMIKCAMIILKLSIALAETDFQSCLHTNFTIGSQNKTQ